MELSTAQQVLVILLSVALAVLLLVSIIAVVLVIRLLVAIKVITTKAEKLIASAEAAADIFKKASGPVGILNVVRSIVNIVQQKRKS